MLKIQPAVEEIVYQDEEALTALASGYMNFSAYAKRIHKTIEKLTKKPVKPAGVVVSLSRLHKKVGKVHPLVQDVVIKNITTKSPVCELVFEKTPQLLARLSSVYEKVKTGPDDFLTMTLSTTEVTVICSDALAPHILKHLGKKPAMTQTGLATIGLSLDPKYYPMPNITFSLIRRIARQRIPLAETITTRTEIIFVFYQKDLSRIVELFRI